MKVIFNADDLGVSHGINIAIEKAYSEGVLTSSSIRTNGAYFQEAVNLIKTKIKGLGVGLHINLTDGRAHTSAMSLKDGSYKYSFISYLVRLQQKDHQLLNEIENEIAVQFKILKNKGIKIDHVDSEEHVHMIPEIFRIVCKLCKANNIRTIRLCHEPHYFISAKHSLRQIPNLSYFKWSLLKNFAGFDEKILREEKLKTTRNYYGILYTNQMDSTSILAILDHALKHQDNTVEIATHPALPYENAPPHTSKKFEKYASLMNRKVELEGLLNPRVREFIEDNHIILSKFSGIN